jgi:hypothetical protein
VARSQVEKLLRFAKDVFSFFAPLDQCFVQDITSYAQKPDTGP